MVDTINAMTEESRVVNVKSITDKVQSMTDRERAFVFNYIREGDLPDHLKVNGGPKA